MRTQAILVTFASLLLTAPFAMGAAPGGEALPVSLDAGGEVHYAVGFHALPRDMAPGDTYNGATVVQVDRVLHFARVATDTPATFKARTSLDDNVRYVEADPEIQLIQYTPNDPDYGSQYGPQQINGPQAWDTTLGDWDANVCIVDSGVRYTHEDLDDNYRGGTDTYNGDSDPWDDNGHGTHVAGTVAAGLDNGVGIAGMGNVGHYAAKALSASGGGSWSSVASAIRWCADNVPGNVVISMSLGASSGSSTLLDAVQYAHGQGALLVAAAGNSGPCSDCVGYPAAYSEVIAVTCTDSSESQCSFSSDGPESELAAPGSSIYSTCYSSDTSYCRKSGTSMSTPHVSGAAALVWSQVPTMSRDSLRQTLRDTAQDLGSAGWDAQYGYGEVDAGAAMAAATGGGGGGGGGDPALVYSEDFTDATGWHKSSGTTDLWRLGSGCLGYTSASYSLQFNNADTNCDYDTGSQATGWARSPVIDLSGKSSATLEFQHAWETESYSGAYDVMKVQVSSDGGSTWTTVAQWDSRDANQLSFGGESIDVSGYATSDFRVRFHFDSLDGVANGYQGWHVDDVEVWAS